MPWLYLTIAGIFEVVWSTAMKYAEGFSNLVPSVIMVVGMIVSFYFLSMATRILPLGTAYATWTGIGAVGAIIVGAILFHEPVTFSRILFLAFIIVGILGLKLTSH